MEPTNTTNVANRRASLRKPPRRTIRLQCRRGALGLGPNLGSSYINVSETGVQVVTNVPLAVGDEVEIIFDGFGMKTTVKRTGDVRWATAVEGGGCRAGIHFQKPIPFRDVQAISAP
jgi:hypothetical protein